MNKTIVLVMPTVSDLSYLIHDALEHHGFTVINPLTLPKPKRKYPSFSARCYSQYRKIFFNDKETARRLKNETALAELCSKLEKVPGDVYSLFIRCDLYDKNFIHSITKKCKSGNISYQFDGLSRYPLIYERISLFDRFYVFDPRDIKNTEYPLLPSTNFYFEHTINQDAKIEYDFYYVGAHHESRYSMVSSFASYLEKMGWSSNFSIYPLDIHDNPEKFYPNKNITILENIIPFTENTKLSQKAKVLVDFVINEHSGLSFRTFEALGYRKKLITTNSDIIHYDFYHPNNIFIWDGNNFDGIKDFINLPYYELPKDIYNKYCFKNWINYVLNISPHQPLSLPSPGQISIMPKRKKIYLICFDDPRPTGGIKQLYKMAEILNKLGYHASIIHKQEGFKLNWFEHSVPVTYFPDLYNLLKIKGKKPKWWQLGKYLKYKFNKHFKKNRELPEKDAIIMVPEVLGLQISNILDYKIIIYNQNNHYTFLDYPYFDKPNHDPYLHKNVLAIFTVSDYAHQYLSMAYPNKKIFNTRISLSNKFYVSEEPKKKQIAFMPRKLSQDSQQVFQLLKNNKALDGWEFIPIDNKLEHEVIKILQQSAIFLSFNHIEGFGLPPIEAMACGCYVIGYAGNAGKEYFLPEFSTLIPDLDVLKFAVELEKLIMDYNLNPETYIQKGRLASEFVKNQYSYINESQAVRCALNDLGL